VKGNITKKGEYNYHSIMMKECGIHQGKSDGYQKMSHCPRIGVDHDSDGKEQ
jgi:hypothetical protein